MPALPSRLSTAGFPEAPWVMFNAGLQAPLNVTTSAPPCLIHSFSSAGWPSHRRGHVSSMAIDTYYARAELAGA